MPAIPFITGDSLLRALFKIRVVPTHVWIDSSRTVRFIVDGYNTNASSVSKFTRGEPLNLAETPSRARVVPDPALTALREVTKNGSGFYSYIFPCDRRKLIVQTTMATAGSEKVNHIARKCLPVLELIKVAFEEAGRYNFKPAGAVKLDIADSSKYFRPRDILLLDKWLAENRYSYEIQVPAANAGEVYKMFQDDLRRFFNLDIKVVKTKVPCLALVRTSAKDKLRTSGGLKEIISDRDFQVLRNIPFNQLAFKLLLWLGMSSPYPFVDQTGYQGNIDMIFSLADLESFSVPVMRRHLQKYDLDLAEKEMVTDVMLVAERKEPVK